MSKVKTRDLDSDTHTKAKLRHELRRKETRKVKRHRKKDRERNEKFFVKDKIPMYENSIVIVPERAYYKTVVVWVPDPDAPPPYYKRPVIRSERVIVPEHERKVHHYLGERDITPYIQERSRGSKKFGRKMANRRIRYAKEQYDGDTLPLSIKGAKYKKLYDLWWSYY